MKIIKHKFVEYIPIQLEQDILYISVEYKTAVHLCICGCGNKVVTPLTPTDWELRFDGKTVSLSPSIGNWNFKCKSHYFITRNSIRHARRWEDWEIEEGRNEDSKNKESFYRKLKKKRRIVYIFRYLIEVVEGSLRLPSKGCQTACGLLQSMGLMWLRKF